MPIYAAECVIAFLTTEPTLPDGNRKLFFQLYPDRTTTNSSRHFDVPVTERQMLVAKISLETLPYGALF